MDTQTASQAYIWSDQRPSNAQEKLGRASEGKGAGKEGGGEARQSETHPRDSRKGRCCSRPPSPSLPPRPPLRLRLSLSFNAPLTPWWLREMPSVFLMPRLDRRKFTGGEERLRRRRSAEGLAVAGDRRFSLVAQERKCWIGR